MKRGRANVGRRVRRLVTLLGCGAFTFGFLGSCDDRLITLTQYIDPCGTILGNCNPGDFTVNAAGVGDYCVDPTCTVPGMCGDGQALGTITDICP